MNFYSGTLCCQKFEAPYYPDRVMRQFGFVQGIPKEPMVQSKDRKGLMDYHWKSWLLDHVEEASRVKVSYQWQCTDTYMEWYASVVRKICKYPCLD